MTPEHETINHIIDITRQNVRENEEVMPLFFVGDEENMHVVGASFRDDKEKDLAAEAVKKIAKEKGAEFVLSVAEIWIMNDPDAAKDYYSNPDKYKNMGDHPKAREVIYFSLETKTRNWVGRADILPGRKMGVVEWMAPGITGGRFSNFLGEKPTLN